MKYGKPKRKIITPIEYRPRRLYRWFSGYLLGPFMAFISGAILLGTLLSLSDPDFIGSAFIWSLAIGILLANVAWKLFQFAFFNKLLLWDTGLEVYIFGVHSFVLWEDLEHFGWKTSGKLKGWGIYPNRIERQAAGFFARKRIFSEQTNFVPLDQIVRLPRQEILDRRINMAAFKQTPLGEDLLHFAPHLFGEEKAKHEDRDISRLTTDYGDNEADDFRIEIEQARNNEQS